MLGKEIQQPDSGNLCNIALGFNLSEEEKKLDRTSFQQQKLSFIWIICSFFLLENICSFVDCKFRTVLRLIS